MEIFYIGFRLSNIKTVMNAHNSILSATFYTFKKNVKSNYDQNNKTIM